MKSLIFVKISQWQQIGERGGMLKAQAKTFTGNRINRTGSIAYEHHIVAVDFFKTIGGGYRTAFGA
jgi:hypothetical protein